ncbi:MAG: hypothetical protein LBD99_06450 [Candidatus Margulisbacteria bacterium]|jgi:hypothetical protein|nr:hypothetical protein [Candidatus Margulisiibacteriota bacterium]
MSWRLKLAAGLMLASTLAWPVIAAAPFLPLGDKGKAVLAAGAFIFGQAAWNIGLIIGGAEAVVKRQEIGARLKKIFRGT